MGAHHGLAHPPGQRPEPVEGGHGVLGDIDVEVDDGLAPGERGLGDIAVGLEAAQNLVLEIHEARGPLHDLDIAAPYVAGENQRLRIESGDTVSITSTFRPSEAA